MISTSSGKKEKIRLWSVCFWLFVWQLLSMHIGQEILLVSPVTVVLRLSELIRETDFWGSVAFSFFRIAGGFFIAAVAGILLASASARFFRVRELLSPLVLTVKTIPVASFTILVLLWLPSRNLSVFISFLMVFPILYTSILNGIENTSPELLEMAKVFHIPKLRAIRYIYSFQILPFFYSACQTALGLCWKAGTAAEMIGNPKGSIGEKLYQSKLYMNSPDLLSWTVVIILISLLFEKGFLFFLRHFLLKAEKNGLNVRTVNSEKSKRRVPLSPNTSIPEYSPTISGGKIQCVNISKSFTDKVVLQNFSADFPTGKISSLTGASGQGKTTLIRLLTGLETLDSGKILGMKNKKTSIVFQDDRLCENLNPIQNIRLVSRRKIPTDEITQTMKKIGLTDCEKQPVCEFSGGMRRRVAILRALYSDFDILLLDEPFKGIDSPTIEKIVKLLLERTFEKTVIIVSHEPLPQRLPISCEIDIPK